MAIKMGDKITIADIEIRISRMRLKRIFAVLLRIYQACANTANCASHIDQHALGKNRRLRAACLSALSALEFDFWKHLQNLLSYC